MKHIILTRLGLAKFDEAWFERKLPLFAAVTVASLRGQSCQDFEWLILVDARMPGTAREALDGILAGMGNAHVVPIDTAGLTSMRNGSFDWVSPAFRSYLLGQGIIEDPGVYYLSSLLDDDDAWNRDMAAMAMNEAESSLEALNAQERPPWVLNWHTKGRVFTYTRGLNWYPFHGRAMVSDWPCQSMSIFVLTRFSSGISACSSRHKLWPSFANVMNFELEEIFTEAPMWAYTRHGDSLGEWQCPAEAEPWHGSEAFAIDWDGVTAWQQGLIAKGRKGDRAGNDFRSLDQYSLQFDVTALNEQIEALKEAVGRGEPSTKAMHLLRTAEARRTELLKRFLLA